MEYRNCLLLLAVLAGLLYGPAAGSANAGGTTVVEDVRVGLTPGRTRVVLDLTSAPTYRVLPQDDPEAIAIELEQAELSAPAGSSERFAGSSVRQLNSAVVDDGRLRIELLLRQPDLRLRAFPMPPGGGRGHRLVLDLYQDATAGEPEAAPVATAEPGPGERRISREAGASRLDTQAPMQQAAAPQTQGADAGTEPGSTPAQARSRQPTSPGLEISFSGTLEQEWAYASARNRNQKFETLIQPRWDVGLPGGGASVTAIARLRLDAVGDLGPDASKPDNYSSATAPWHNNSHSALSLRALYLDFRAAGADWRLGKQQVVWGRRTASRCWMWSTRRATASSSWTTLTSRGFRCGWPTSICRWAMRPTCSCCGFPIPPITNSLSLAHPLPPVHPACCRRCR
ncbi:AMIN domain-containing protein [Kineobactrum salinum]|uniref:AMIN domain-containing protein n=1 Tax=Kineobactrum salinum TaxID=2708301 RepID=A0A6C0U177_9GAMM|nr:AMIN domain-containing protein [Kineobactrum salinum]QIB64737.1 AMIN domain-containing protein [Kineobactrum salinum]